MHQEMRVSTEQLLYYGFIGNSCFIGEKRYSNRVLPWTYIKAKANQQHGLIEIYLMRETNFAIRNCKRFSRK